MTSFAIGDIQGCYEEFRELLDVMQYRENADQLWLVGDLVNRGPDNVRTLDYIMSLDRAHVVLGNHDLHFLAVAQGVGRQHSSDTLTDLLESPRLTDYIAWMRALPFIHVDEQLGYIMVHAGLPSIWTLDECFVRAAEVEAVLRGDDFDDFLSHMYGNQPTGWQEDLAGYDRLRVITNYFTRLRYCNAKGEMELTFKEKIQPQGYAPWFSFPRPEAKSLPIVFGHWAALEGHTGTDHAIPLDTGCVWGRELTGIRLDDGKFFQVPSRNR